MTSKTEKLVDPWELLRDVAAMLPYKDEAVARRMIDHHENQHKAAKRLEATQGAD